MRPSLVEGLEDGSLHLPRLTGRFQGRTGKPLRFFGFLLHARLVALDQEFSCFVLNLAVLDDSGRVAAYDPGLSFAGLSEKDLLFHIFLQVGDGVFAAEDY